MDTYKITNVASKLCLNIAGDNITVLTEHQDVTQWSDTGTNEQKWVIDNFPNSGPVLSAVDTSYGLNIWLGSLNKNNCDVFPVAGNEEDSTISFVDNTGSYCIKLTNHDLYLTAPNTTAGASIVWSSYKGNDNQKWTFTKISDTVTTSKWSWSASNGSANAAQTQLAYNAIIGKGAISNFSYLVWNDLCNKVQECITRAGSSWLTTCGLNGAATPTHADAKMSATDKTLTAARFNAVRGNINSRVSTGVSPVVAGDMVLGSYFTNCTTALNTWIGTLNDS